MAGLPEDLQALVDEHGLPEVHRALMAMPGFCRNCGCPLIKGELHNFAGMGSCWIQPVR